jgi:hypothetical protein
MIPRIFIQLIFASTLAFSQAPSVVSLSPLNGTKSAATFTVVVTDPNGSDDLSTIRFLVNPTPDAAQGCYVEHIVGTNLLTLRNDNGNAAAGSITFGAAPVVSNSQCSLTGVGASASASGNNYTVTIPLTFKPAFAGMHHTHVRVWDKDNTGVSTWSQEGHWLVPAFETSDVSGLTSELAARPVRGPSFLGGRAAVITASGALNAAAGNASDCLHVDGTSAPCAGATVSSTTDRFDFRTASVTQTLTLSGIPTGEIQVFRNGILQFPGSDYDRQGTTGITFRSQSQIQPYDLIQVIY